MSDEETGRYHIEQGCKFQSAQFSNNAADQNSADYAAVDSKSAVAVTKKVFESYAVIKSDIVSPSAEYRADKARDDRVGGSVGIYSHRLHFFEAVKHGEQYAHRYQKAVPVYLKIRAGYSKHYSVDSNAPFQYIIRTSEIREIYFIGISLDGFTHLVAYLSGGIHKRL